MTVFELFSCCLSINNQVVNNEIYRNRIIKIAWMDWTKDHQQLNEKRLLALLPALLLPFSYISHFHVASLFSSQRVTISISGERRLQSQNTKGEKKRERETDEQVAAPSFLGCSNLFFFCCCLVSFLSYVTLVRLIATFSI